MKIYAVNIRYCYHKEYKYGTNYDWSAILSYHATIEGANKEIKAQIDTKVQKEHCHIEIKDDGKTYVDNYEGYYIFSIEELELKD